MSIQNWKNKIIKGSQLNSGNYDQDSLNSQNYPYAMVCFEIDENTMIAVGSDPLSPKDFMIKNSLNNFIVDFSIAPRIMFTRFGQKTVYYAKLVESIEEGKKDFEMDFVFHSSDHLRYENGRHISGPHGGAPRAIKVEANISGNEGYTVTMFNTEGGQSVVQMAPKQMKLTNSNSERIQLKGFGRDQMGASFDDYGLTIFRNGDNIQKCILHMYDRGVDIEYLESENQTTTLKNENVDENVDVVDYFSKFKGLPMNVKMDLAKTTDELTYTGCQYYEKDDLKNAIIYFEKALKVFPLNDDALNNLAVCYSELYNYPKMNEAKIKLELLRKLGL